MARLPGKKIIGLVIFLMVLTIGVLWFTGYQDNKRKETKREAYLKEILAKTNSLETLALQNKELEWNPKDMISAPVIDPITIATTTNSANRSDQIEDYSIAMAKALKPLSVRRGNEVEALLQATQNQDPKILTAVTTSRIAHEQAYAEIIRIIIPNVPELEKIHRQLIYELTGLIGILYNMEEAMDKPSQGLIASKAFIKNYPNFMKVIEDLNVFYNKQNLDKTNNLNLFWSLK